MKGKIIKYLLFIFLFVFSIGKIKAESLAAGSYKIGDEVTYNGMKFYVIANSDKNSDAVTMLKAEPIMQKEIDLSGLEIKTQIENSTNGYSDDYLHMQYMYKDDCVSAGENSGCISDYKVSSIKQVVDAWSYQKINSQDLKVDATGYNARLITYDEIINNLGYKSTIDGSGNSHYEKTDDTPNWLYNDKYGDYCTMSSVGDSILSVWNISVSGNLGSYYVSYEGIVRPVITLKKEVELNIGQQENVNTSGIVQRVDVPDTKKNRIILFSIIGGALVFCGLIILYFALKNKYNKKNK